MTSVKQLRTCNQDNESLDDGNDDDAVERGGGGDDDDDGNGNDEYGGDDCDGSSGYFEHDKCLGTHVKVRCIARSICRQFAASCMQTVFADQKKKHIKETSEPRCKDQRSPRNPG